jgi:chromosome segregation ATPase
MTLEVDALQTELEAMKKSEARYREAVTSSQAQIEDFKTHFYALRDSEAEAKESLVFTTSDLQKVSMQLAIAKEALEWVGGDNAALTAELAAKNAELEAKNAEVVCTKQGEARAKAAFADYSLKLQKMRLDLEDASKLADKVPIKAQCFKPQVAKSHLFSMKKGY